MDRTGNRSASQGGRSAVRFIQRSGRMNLRARTPLELQQITQIDGERLDGPPSPPAIYRLEGKIASRPLSIANMPSQFRYFLDGSQRTYNHYIHGHFPIVYSVAAAGILQRDQLGNSSLVPGTLELRHTWFIPERAQTLPDFVERIKEQNMTIVDPLERYEDEETYAIALADYSHFIDMAFDAAKKARADLESDILCAWSSQPERRDDPGWIVVDGALRVCAPRAIGLVKSFTRQHLTGSEATTLYDLPVGHRTSAFQAEDRYRSDLDLDGLGAAVKSRTLWYMRLHDATGDDARRGLIRIEASPNVTDSDEIDELSQWLLTEKRPRASADARWANLLYPVHFLERILKQYVDRELGAVARVVK